MRLLSVGPAASNHRPISTTHTTAHITWHQSPVSRGSAVAEEKRRGSPAAVAAAVLAGPIVFLVAFVAPAAGCGLAVPAVAVAGG